MSVIELRGCRTTPIAGYLKALGVLRLVASQADPDARGRWHGDQFVLDTRLGEDELVAFFLDEYRPTPVISPWNGGSGFHPKDQQAGIAAIEASDDQRFQLYRDTISVGRRLVADPRCTGSKDEKRTLIALCRAELPDEALRWIDAAVVLLDDRLAFPPLLGTGGNDGRLDFSNNFMQRLAELLLQPRRRGRADPRVLLRGALFGEDPGPLDEVSVGQFAPGSGESAAVASVGQDSWLVNPWDFVLLVEGSMLFASGAARRLGASLPPKAAMPFCVEPSPIGYGTAADAEAARGEVWCPVWSQPTGLTEIERLFGEGRARWDGRSARTGLDLAKAAATLAVDRGIDRFARHGLLRRNGRSYLSVPLGTVVVGARPEVDILKTVDRWLTQLTPQLPAAAASAHRRLSEAQFRAAAAPDRNSRQRALQDVLVELAELERLVVRLPNERRPPMPVRELDASTWLQAIDDRSTELRLAVAFASSRDRIEGDQPAPQDAAMASTLRPIARSAWSDSWARDPLVPGVTRRPISSVLADVLVRRVRGIEQRRGEDVAGRPVRFDHAVLAELGHLDQLVREKLDLARLRRLVHGLVLLDWRRTGHDVLAPAALPAAPALLHPAVAVLLPFGQRRPITVHRGGDAERDSGTELALRVPPSWAELLRADRASEVLQDALHRLRLSGLNPAPRTIPVVPGMGPRLAAALLVPVHRGAVMAALRRLCPTTDLGTVKEDE